MPAAFPAVCIWDLDETLLKLEVLKSLLHDEMVPAPAPAPARSTQHAAPAPAPAPARSATATTTTTTCCSAARRACRRTHPVYRFRCWQYQTVSMLSARAYDLALCSGTLCCATSGWWWRIVFSLVVFVSTYTGGCGGGGRIMHERLSLALRPNLHARVRTGTRSVLSQPKCPRP